jgi:hypothetical protein
LLLLSKKNHVGTRGAWPTARVLGGPQRTRGAWAALGINYARAPFGDTWRLGHGAGPKVPGSYDSKYYYLFYKY